jgi:hypothetical protein
MNTVKLQLGSQSFVFEMHRPDASWNAVPLIYAFWADGTDGRAQPGIVIPYIGQTGKGSSRFPHPDWEEGVRDYGATHVLAMVADRNDGARCDLERRFIQAYNPPMNVQHKPKSYFGGGLLNTTPNYADGILAAALKSRPGGVGLINSMLPSGGVTGLGLVPTNAFSDNNYLRLMLANALKRC